MTAGESIRDSQHVPQFPVDAGEGILDLRHVEGERLLYQLSSVWGQRYTFGELHGHAAGGSLSPAVQGLRMMMMEWLVVLSRCHFRRRRR